MLNTSVMGTMPMPNTARRESASKDQELPPHQRDDAPTLNGQLPPSRRLVIGEQGRRVRFYRNGDPYFKGIWYLVSSYRSWDSLLEDLNHHLSDQISLPKGVRHIFSIDGSTCLRSLEEFVHSRSYVCSSSERFKTIDYLNASQPMWAFVSSTMGLPPVQSIRATFEKEPNEFVTPRIITVIRNGLKPRRVVRHLLNKRTAQSFEYVMQDITSAVKLNSGVVRKLYGLSGKPVSCLADFFSDDHVFVAFGLCEKVTCDDFDIISEEYRRMNVWSGRRSNYPRRAGRMPIRNDGFRKLPDLDPKSNLAQAMKLPAELASSVEILSLLGDGNTALVFKARFRNPMTMRSDESLDALKIISRESVEEMHEFIEAEIEILSNISHEFIVELRDSRLIDGTWYMRLELLEDGDLFEYLKKERRTLSERDAASCTSCLCSALDYLHGLSIVHRDVKPENLLVFKESPQGPLMLKLTDFGLACRIESNELLYHVCGTPTYVAPEVLAEFGYSFKADCWSVGIILYILLAGYPPFGVDEDAILFNKILRGTFDFPSPSFDSTSYSPRYIIRCLLTTEPNQRFSASQVLHQQWIKNLGFADPPEEERCMLMLGDLMSSLGSNTREFEESGSEYFFSRRASMDQFSDCDPASSKEKQRKSSAGEKRTNAEHNHLDAGNSRKSSFTFIVPPL